MNTQSPTKMIALGAVALILIGGGIGAYFTFNGGNSEGSESIDIDQEILPDVNAVPEDKPLPPAPKELVQKKKKFKEIDKKVLRIFDVNKDGKIAREEFRSVYEKNFNYLDHDKNGKLHRKEWRHPAFKSMDLNKNRALEFKEWMRFRDWCFDTFWDANKDAVAVPGEWKK